MSKSDELDDTMRVLSTGTCDTLTGSSRLTYHIGSLPDGEIYLRVHSNTGGGFFSQEWIALQDILTALKKRPDGRPCCSRTSRPGAMSPDRLILRTSSRSPGKSRSQYWMERLSSGQRNLLMLSWVNLIMGISVLRSVKN
jgi:hypothetical protein